MSDPLARAVQLGLAVSVKYSPAEVLTYVPRRTGLLSMQSWKGGDRAGWLNGPIKGLDEQCERASD